MLGLDIFSWQIWLMLSYALAFGFGYISGRFVAWRKLRAKEGLDV